MKTTLPDFKVRLPQSLKDQIEEAARQTNRSMNGEIVHRLEMSFAAATPLEEEVRRLAKQVDALQRRVDNGMPSLAIEDDDE